MSDSDSSDGFVPEKPVEIETGYDCVVIVDGLPVAPAAKYEKLLKVVSKKLGSLGKLAGDDAAEAVFMPTDSAGASLGYAFIEYASPRDARSAVRDGDGFKLDKSHVLRVQPYGDFEEVDAVPEEYTAPEAGTYESWGNMRSWLTDTRARDQFITRYSDMTELFWNDSTLQAQRAESVHARDRWSDSYVAWSPKGTFLATLHPQGLQLWGGQEWQRLMRFRHQGIKSIEFSPCERYMMTWNDPREDNPDDPNGLIVWEVRTGKKLRAYHCKKGLQWPIFKWSHDGSYLARKIDNAIQVYATPEMKLLEKKSIKIPHVVDFAWSPTDPLMAYWVPEDGSTPARVTMIRLPTRETVAQRNFYNVKTVDLVWQKAGDFFCARVDRYKSKKTEVTQLEIMRIRSRDIPTESLELAGSVLAFDFEPVGPRFAVIHGSVPRPDVSFYTLGDVKKGEIKLLKTLEKKAANQLFWAPKGRFIIVAGLKNLNGALEFWNVDDCEMMGSEEHFMCTDVDWDPTGRYVCTSVSSWRGASMENGYNMWNFQGKLLYRQAREKFYQFLWRPRPATLLTKEKVEEIEGNLKKYTAQMEKEDERIRKAEVGAAEQERDQQRKEFIEYSKKWAERYRAQKAQRIALRKSARYPGGYDSDVEDDVETVVKTTEEVISVKEETLPAPKAE